MKKIVMSVVTLAAGFALALPRVSNVQVDGSNATRVRVSYTLTGGPAVVTLDVLTNSESWVSIGVDALVGTNSAKHMLKGDVFCRVTGDGVHVIEWNAYKAWGVQGGTFAAGEMKFDVKAYPLYDAPDYLVTDLREGVAASDRVRYYPSESFLPGGLLSNPAYRTTHLVQRRIHARNVQFTMGATVGSAGAYTWFEPRETVDGVKYSEQAHRVTLTNDFYLGVFEITQAQWQHVVGSNPSYYSLSPESPMRPADSVSYARLRESAHDCEQSEGDKQHPDYSWPRPPHPNSFLGKLRAMTGQAIDYEIPGDAEWEFACRAGYPEGYWNDGSDAKDLAAMPGRNNANGGFLPGGSSYPMDRAIDSANGTAVCGSYAPNRWGIYDMHGNVQEWCLDWFQAAYRGGTVNVNPNDPMRAADGTAASTLSNQRVRRGGSFVLPAFNSANANDCRASSRTGTGMGASFVNMGGRVACRAGLK